MIVSTKGRYALRVMIDLAEHAFLVKGDRIKVKLRINPSGFKVTKENIELDAWYSDTYFLEDGKSQTRASYVTPSDYYELVNIEPDKNEKDEELEGQWIALYSPKGLEIIEICLNYHLLLIIQI